MIRYFYPANLEKEHINSFLSYFQIYEKEITRRVKHWVEDNHSIPKTDLENEKIRLIRNAVNRPKIKDIDYDVNLPLEKAEKKFYQNFLLLDKFSGRMLKQEIDSLPEELKNRINPVFRSDSIRKSVIKADAISPHDITFDYNNYAGLSTESLNAIAKQNVNLIKSLTDEYKTKVQNILVDAVNKGKSQSQIFEELLHVNGVTESQAKFWAEDQATKFFGEIQRVKAIKAGFPGFIWITVQDGKVRTTHAKFAGKYYPWDKGTGEFNREYPGKDYRCRCFARPSFPENAPNAVSYQVEKDAIRLNLENQTEQAQNQFNSFYNDITKHANNYEVDKVKRIDKFLKANYQSWANKQSQVTKTALENYQYDSFLDVNSMLRATKGNYPVNSTTGIQIATIDKAMETATLPKRMEVYRGIRDEAIVDQLFALEVGESYKDFGYSSTSISAGMATEWAQGKLILTIKFPKGYKAIYIPSLSKRMEGEFELLLKAGTKFRIRKKFIADGIRYMELEIR